MHNIFAEITWWLLFVTLMIRPLYMAFRTDWLKKAMDYRRVLGLMAAGAMVAHVAGYMVEFGKPVTYLGSELVWNWDSVCLWGMVALIIAIPPVFLANILSKKMVGKFWTVAHVFVYFVFIFAGLHVAVARDEYLFGALPVVIWGLFWLNAWMMKRLR